MPKDIYNCKLQGVFEADKTTLTKCYQDNKSKTEFWEQQVAAVQKMVENCRVEHGVVHCEFCEIKIKLQHANIVKVK